jgi:uncharacterized membrane protein YphA (DoxX/SURF4 family)
MSFVLATEVLLRIVLGLRFLYSGVSNVIRWPHAVGNAKLIFPFGHTFFGFVAVFLLVAGGLGMTLGLYTRVSALMLAIFLIPTFQIQRHGMRTTPALAAEINAALTDEALRGKFRMLTRRAYHGHETGWQDNLVFLFAALFYVARGSMAFGLDNWRW